MKNYYPKKTINISVWQLTLLIGLLLGSLYASAQAPDFAWAKQAQGNHPFTDEEGHGIAHDTQGNSYVTGKFNGSATFGSTTLTSSGGDDVFVAKYDAAGNVLWAKKAGGTFSVDVAQSIAVDGSGNTYVTGYFNGNSAVFGSTTLSSNGNYDVFVAKYDAAGNILWAKNAGGISDDIAQSIAVDGSGNIYVTGYFSGSATFGSTTLTSSGSLDDLEVFVAKYDAAGNVLWAKNAGGTDQDIAQSIAVDGSGNSYITGSFQGSATFGSTTLTNGGLNGDAFVAKLDAAGNVLWAKQSGGSVSDTGYGIAVDGNGNSYVTGSFQGSATFGSTTLTSSGSGDVFVAKYDAAGNVLWAKKAGGTSEERAHSIAVDGSGNSYVTGLFWGSATFGSNTLIISGFVDVFVAKYDAAGNVLWAKQAGGVGYDTGNGIAVDGNGNSYVTGFFTGSATFDSITLTSTLDDEGPNDAFVAKYDAAGNVLWATNPVGFTASDIAYSIAVDGSGNSYVTGTFRGNATFGSTMLTSKGINGSTDVFVAKYDAAGNVLWAKQAGSNDFEIAQSIAVDGSGNSYVAGYFEESITFGNITLISNIGQDVFVAKYDASGNVLWAKKAGGTGDDKAYSIAVDGSGNSYVTGEFRGSATFGSTTLTSAGSTDVFVAKYDAAGNVLWVKNAGGNSHDEAQGIAVDGSGNSYVTGLFDETITFGITTLTSSGDDVGEYEVFVAKYDAAGNVLWAKKAGGTGDDRAYSIAIDGSDNSYVTGYFEGNATFGSTSLTSSGLQDIFVTKYNAAGNVLWAKKAGGTGEDIANSIAIDFSGNSYVAGYIEGSATFGSITLTSSGLQDIFVAKFDAAGNVLWGKKAGSIRENRAQGIAVDLSGNSYVAGYIEGSATFGSTTLFAFGTEAFIAKINADQYNLNTTVVGSGTVTKNPSQASYLAGSSVQLTATPASGFQFSGWSGDASGSTNPLTVTMNSNKNITATFTAVPGVTGFNLMDAISSQSIQPLVNGAVLNLATLPNRKLNIRALTNPTKVGSVVFKLSGQQTKSRTDNSGPHYSLQGDDSGNYFSWIPPVGTYTLTAGTYSGSNGSGIPGGQQTITFTVIDQINPVMYNLNTAIVGSGTVTKSPNQTSYTNGSTVTLTATPVAGYQFIGWSGDASGTTNPLAVVMNANKNITATFTAVPTVGVTGFNLINASSDLSIQPLVSGAVLNLATLPIRSLNIRALTNPSTVGSVVFNLSGQQTKVRSDDSGPHYSLQGDNSGDYFSWTPPVGTYTLTARTYSGSNGSGTPGAQQTFTFTVIDDANAMTRTAGTGSNEKALNIHDVNAYPSPFIDKLMIELTSETAAETAKVTLNTIDGKTVYQKEVKLNKDRVSEELDGLSKLPAGMYFLMLQLDEKPFVLKVMKQ